MKSLCAAWCIRFCRKRGWFVAHEAARCPSARAVCTRLSLDVLLEQDVREIP